MREDNPYVPVNSPAIGDLLTLFDFDHAGDDGGESESQGG